MLDELLDYLGGTLDKPGRAVRGVLGGRPEEAAAAIPFSDTLGITDARNAVSGKDLAHDWFGLDPNDFTGKAAGFGLDVALDPTTYLGGFLGRAAGKALGRGADLASVARGPGYGTTLEGLLDAQKGIGRSNILDFADHPGFAKALSEVPEGSQYLGHGAEALALQTPGGDVARISKVFPGDATRPIDPGILPTTRAVDFPGGKMNLRVERSPFAEPITNTSLGYTTLPAVPSDVPTGWGQISPASEAAGPRRTITAADRLAGDLASRGIDFVDNHMGNVGMFKGNPVVIDSGALAGLKPGELPLHAATRPNVFPDLEAGGKAWAAAGSPLPAYAPLVQPGQPDKITRFLLDLIGGQSAMQKALAAGRSAPGYERTFGDLGASAGVSLAAY